MSTQPTAQSFDAVSQHSVGGPGAYEPSVTSSASSSQPSIFSESDSAQSSIASSISDDFRQSQEDARDRACAQAQLQQSQDGRKPSFDHSNFIGGMKPDHTSAPSYADVTSVPVQQRQHPRRTSLAKDRKPPSMPRQCDRKVDFVDNLVDCATQMVEVIWPLSAPRQGDGCTGRGVLPLRTYIEETLRRSRTSYSTLQVALYYLILIKPCVPKIDFTQEQKTDSSADRALMCGRRMFLAALILASKYLQDRNYSAKAWSKMSGLKIGEINTNERTFLAKVSWKLHIPDLIFKRWEEVVLKYTPYTHQPPPDHGISVSGAVCFKSIIPMLTPELDNIPIRTKPITQWPALPALAIPAPPGSALGAMQLESTSNEGTPTPSTVLPPSFLEPKTNHNPPTPALARMGPLPTPQLTPSSVASNTPAASADNSRRPSMSSAMSMARKTSFNLSAIDACPRPANGAQFSRPSHAPSATSLLSSPESMIIDNARSSRASSVSSISTVSSTASGAPTNPRTCLARQATCRSANLPVPTNTTTTHSDLKSGAVHAPIIISSHDHHQTIPSSPSPPPPDFSLNEKSLHLPHKHSKHAPHPTAALPRPADASRKRARTRGGPSAGGNRRSDLQAEVRLMLEEAEDELAEDDYDDVGTDVDMASRESSTEPSPAARYAGRMLEQAADKAVQPSADKAVQPSAALLGQRDGTLRLPVRKAESSAKRTCCAAGLRNEGMGTGQQGGWLYGEVA